MVICISIGADVQLSNPVKRVYFSNTQHTVNQEIAGMLCHTPVSGTPQSPRPVLTGAQVNPSHKR